MKIKKKIMIAICAIAALVVIFLIYTASCYHADEKAQEALVSDDAVLVSKTNYGWFFDGPSEEDALIFYPGARVEDIAYAPLLHLLAAEGLDVYLMHMPFNLAFFGRNSAEDILRTESRENWYIGGHSLGGAMAADYAAANGDKVDGIIILASYPTKALVNSLTEISIYGSEDKILNLDNVEEGKEYSPDNFYELVIEGGNHSQFGNYGFQDGDGTASISAEEQQKQTVNFIMESLK